MTAFRLGIWVAIAVLGAFLAWSTLDQLVNKDASVASKSARAAIGGPFEAVRADGTKITRENMLGRPHVLFFGFTHCPDVCPTTLYEASQWLNKLGDEGEKVDVYFVSVDPARDTAPVLAEYLTAFDKRIVGITGSEKQIAKLSKAWRVFAKKEGSGDDYSVSHTATTFLMDAKGDFISTIAYGEDIDTAVAKLKKLIERS